MIKYNKIASYSNYKMADLEEHIKKHWWKYLIGLGLAGAGGYLVYQKYFAKPKEDEKAKPGEKGSPHNTILELMSKKTDSIDASDLNRMESLIEDALIEAEKRHKDDEKVMSAISEFRGILKHIKAAKGMKPEDALLKFGQVLSQWDTLKELDKSPKLKELYNDLLQHDAPIIAYRRHYSTFNIEGYGKIYNIIRELLNTDKHKPPENKDYATKIAQIIFHTRAMKSFFDEMKNHANMPSHVQYVEDLHNAYFPAYFHVGGYHNLVSINSLKKLQEKLQNIGKQGNKQNGKKGG